MTTIHFQEPKYYLLLIVVFSAFLVYLHYRDKADFRSAWQLWTLRVLRFCSYVLIGILLLNPLLERIENEAVPLRTIALMDNSFSVRAWLEGSQRDDGDLRRLISGLKEQGSTDLYSFGRESRPLEDTLAYEEQGTDLHRALVTGIEGYDMASIAQLILVTDGIANAGKDVLSSVDRFPFPISVIGLGDTTTVPDISIERLVYSEVVYVGDDVVVEVDAKVLDATAVGHSLSLRVMEDKKWRVLETRKVNLDPAGLSSFTMTLPIRRAGVTRAQVSIAPLAQERNTKNNYADIYIDAVDDKQMVQVIARAPHPDIGAMVRSLERSDNMETEVAILTSSVKANPEADLIILHDLPNTGDAFFAGLYGAIKAKGTPALFVLSPQADWTAVNELQPFVQVTPKMKTGNRVKMAVNDNFSLFTLDPAWESLQSSYPPLYSPFATYETRSMPGVFAYQQIGNITTQDPLVVMGSHGRQKMGVIFGTGIFRWPIYEYASTESTMGFDALMTKMVQYLTVREDKSKVRLRLNKRLYTPQEKILVQAECYNNSYERITESDLTLLVTAEDASTYPYSLSRVDDHYESSLGPFDPGTYTYRLQADGVNVQPSVSGQFTVQEVNIEEQNLRADHSSLQRLASMSGGDFFVLETDGAQNIIEGLQKASTKASRLVEKKSVSKWLDHGLLLALLVLFLIGEWLLRRIFGTY